MLAVLMLVVPGVQPAAPADDAARQAYVASLAAADLALERGAPVEARGLLAGAPAEQRDWAWHHLLSLTDDLAVEQAVCPDAIVALHAGPAGIVALCADGVVRYWDRGLARQVSQRHLDEWTPDAPVALRPTAVAIGDGARVLVIDAGRIVATLEGHDDRVRCMAFSPDGRRIVTGAGKTTVHLFDTGTGTPLAEGYGHTSLIQCVAFSPDGTRIASGGDDNRVRLWGPDLQRGAALRGHGSSVLDLSFSPDGSRLATASADGTVRLWNVELGTPLGVVATHAQPVTTVVFAPDGTRLATRTADGDVEVRGVATGRLLSRAGPATALAFTADSRWLATGSADGRVTLHAAVVPRYDAMTDGPGTVTDLAFSPDGTRLAAAQEGRLVVWDPAAAAITASAELATGRAIAWTAGGLLAGAGNGVVRLDPDTLAVLDRLDGATDGISTLAANADVVAGCGLDGVVNLWSLGAASPRATWDSGQHAPQLVLDELGVPWAAARSLRALVGEGGTVQTLASPGGRIEAAASLGGTRMVLGLDDGTLAIVDTQTMADPVRLHGHAASVTRLAVQGGLIASGSDDRTVRLWSAGDGRLMLTMANGTAVTALAFTADRLAAGDGNGEVHVWSTEPLSRRRGRRDDGGP